MNEKRIARYIDKLQHIGERTGDIENWIDDAKKDKRSRLAIYKATQEAIEAVCDVISMYLKDADTLQRTTTPTSINGERWKLKKYLSASKLPMV